MSSSSLDTELHSFPQALPLLLCSIFSTWSQENLILQCHKRPSLLHVTLFTHSHGVSIRSSCTCSVSFIALKISRNAHFWFNALCCQGYFCISRSTLPMANYFHLKIYMRCLAWGHSNALRGKVWCWGQEQGTERDDWLPCSRGVMGPWPFYSENCWAGENSSSVSTPSVGRFFLGAGDCAISSEGTVPPPGIWPKPIPHLSADYNYRDEVFPPITFSTCSNRFCSREI